jgi:hypothetical protein
MSLIPGVLLSEGLTCGCGKQARYVIGASQDGVIYSCNKYKRCEIDPVIYTDNQLVDIFYEIRNELIHADKKYAHDPMATAKLGLATIKCELAELEREVLRPKRNEEWMRKEAIQCAAMCVKLLRDVCNKTP